MKRVLKKLSDACKIAFSPSESHNIPSRGAEVQQVQEKESFRSNIIY